MSNAIPDPTEISNRERDTRSDPPCKSSRLVTRRIKLFSNLSGFIKAAYKDPRWLLAAFLFVASITYIGSMSSTSAEINELNVKRDDMLSLMEELVAVVELGTGAQELVVESENFNKAYLTNLKALSATRAQDGDMRKPLMEFDSSREWAGDLAFRLDSTIRRIEATRFSHPGSTSSTHFLTDVSKILSEQRELTKKFFEQGQLLSELYGSNTTDLRTLDKFRALGTGFQELLVIITRILENQDARRASLSSTLRDLATTNRQVATAVEDYQRRIRILQIKNAVFVAALLYGIAFCIACVYNVARGKRNESAPSDGLAVTEKELNSKQAHEKNEYESLLAQEIDRLQPKTSDNQPETQPPLPFAD